ncbi:hypothetical protein HYN59_10460 [Flavobacterium album]|uniref:Uncharacterized protein n=1 Tax=Flavobacterium album TaxID=2175091 RepID=A0A2S1QYN6_9FLAO|nr:hypothetical protein [Flavobacterium album]AWH85508.1 hypothetical protein HYN59_10460 [Flavobacterium album]
MKKTLLFALLFLSFAVTAQEDCKTNEVTNEDGTIVKSTNDYMMYEKVFAGTSQFIFFSLSNSDGVPMLNFQMLFKSKEFPKAYCLDKASRMYIQLNNGKIVTLISALDEQCAGLVYDAAEKNNIRVLTGVFLFTVGSVEDLEKFPISFIRVKYATETIDYPVKKELNSETMAKKYYPESYFINSLKCIK